MTPLLELQYLKKAWFKKGQVDTNTILRMYLSYSDVDNHFEILSVRDG